MADPPSCDAVRRVPLADGAATLILRCSRYAHNSKEGYHRVELAQGVTVFFDEEKLEVVTDDEGEAQSGSSTNEDGHGASRKGHV